MVNIGNGVAAFLFKWILPWVVLGASVVRINAVSGVYLVCFLALPLMPNPTRVTLQGRTGIYLKVLTFLGGLACLLQFVFQMVLVGTDSTFTFCDHNESLWRQLGFQRLDEAAFVDGFRLIVPDVAIFLFTLLVLLISKKLVGQTGAGDGDGVVIERRPVTQHQVIEGIRCFIAMVLLGLAGIIVPSVISSVYFVFFLVVATWWSFYKTWGKVFNVLRLLWLIYCGSHLIVLYIAQFWFFQENFYFDGHTNDDTFIPRLLGLTPVINATCTDDPRRMVFADVAWPIFTNPGILVLFYWYLGIEVRSWIDGPEHIETPHSPKKKKVPTATLR